MFQYCKLQFCSFLVLLIIAFMYITESNRAKKTEVGYRSLYGLILISGIFDIIFDGLTAYTVNYLDIIPRWQNLTFHLLFFISLVTVFFICFIYMLKETSFYPDKKHFGYKLIFYCPYIISIILLCLTIHTLQFNEGKYTNYSWGPPVFILFIMAVIYFIGTVIVSSLRWRYISKRKRIHFVYSSIVVIAFFIIEVSNQEALVTSVVVLLYITGIYLAMENPLYGELEKSNHDMVMGFATLIERRDDSTGSHVSRTSRYSEVLAKELRARGYFSDVLTQDYINNLVFASPMHDIGKISIPDYILQKEGKLTDEEYNIMMSHTTIGGEIIKNTFGELQNQEYAEMAYDVARFHHEKWNGKGYPEGLKGNEIPLSARIMAVCDVFDAVSERRCYKEALPLEQCFKIIQESRGIDFDPLIADVFLDIKPLIIKIHEEEDNKKLSKKTNID